MHFEGCQNTYDREHESCFTTFYVFQAIHFFKHQIFFYELFRVKQQAIFFFNKTAIKFHKPIHSNINDNYFTHEMLCQQERPESHKNPWFSMLIPPYMLYLLKTVLNVWFTVL